jgi:hypothetical protein
MMMIQLIPIRTMSTYDDVYERDAAVFTTIYFADYPLDVTGDLVA